jgi:DNA-binding NarL/FixJ family response regulator
MTGHRLQAVDTRNEEAEPAAGWDRDPIVELRIRTLTRSEREMLCLLATGWSNRRIADDRLLSLHTVRTRVQNVLVKLGVHTKLEAVAFAFEHGLVLDGGRLDRCRAPGEDLPRA